MDEVISLRVPSLRVKTGKVVKQIETPRPPDPNMRRPSVDREEKRVTHGGENSRRNTNEQLDRNNPNQRGLSETARDLGGRIFRRARSQLQPI